MFQIVCVFETKRKSYQPTTPTYPIQNVKLKVSTIKQECQTYYHYPLEQNVPLANTSLLNDIYSHLYLLFLNHYLNHDLYVLFTFLTSLGCGCLVIGFYLLIKSVVISRHLLLAFLGSLCHIHVHCV